MRSSFLKVTVGPIFALTFYALPLVSEIAPLLHLQNRNPLSWSRLKKQRWIMRSATTTMHSVAAICLP